MRFNTSIIVKKTNLLRQLQANTYSNVYSYGTRDDERNESNNGEITYNITFSDTKGMEIVEIYKIGDFQFSDNVSKYEKIDIDDLTKNMSNLTESKGTKYEPFYFGSKRIDNDSFSFAFNLDDTKYTNLGNKANLSYIEKDQRKEIKLCSITKKNDSNYKISCSLNQDNN